MEKRLMWLRLLRQLLALDAAAVLRPAQQSSAFILSSYLGILNSRCLLLFVPLTCPESGRDACITVNMPAEIACLKDGQKLRAGVAFTRVGLQWTERRGCPLPDPDVMSIFFLIADCQFVTGMQRRSSEGRQHRCVQRRCSFWRPSWRYPLTWYSGCMLQWRPSSVTSSLSSLRSTPFQCCCVNMMVMLYSRLSTAAMQCICSQIRP